MTPLERSDSHADSIHQLLHISNELHILQQLLIFMIMKTCIYVVAIIGAILVASCGSSWEISGNNIVVNKADKPVEIPAGTYYILPDSIPK